MYAAYGSNMDPAQMALRCPHSPQRGTGWLEGWRLTFGGADIGWEGAMATVAEHEGARVFVVLYEVTEHGVALLTGCTVAERARRLIAVAAPHHREGLERSLVDGRSSGD